MEIEIKNFGFIHYIAYCDNSDCAFEEEICTEETPYAEDVLYNIAKYIDYLETENKLLRKACRLIHQRPSVGSGSKEMHDIDEYCKKLNLEVWKWPRGNFWEY